MEKGKYLEQRLDLHSVRIGIRGIEPCGSTPRNLPKRCVLQLAVSWYEQGKISQEVAARIAGLDRTEFLLALARLGKDSFKVDFADLDRELARG
jgi:predicted HTH domain antitoxin